MQLLVYLLVFLYQVFGNKIGGSMKRNIIYSLLFICISTSLFSLTDNVASNENVEVHKKLKSIIYQEEFNTNEIQAMVQYLSFEERAKFFLMYQISYDKVQFETLLNLIHSLGSWIVGNYTLAIVSDIDFLIFGGMAIAGLLLKNDFLSSGGVGGLIGWYAGSLALPALGASKFNERLKDALNINQKISYNLINDYKYTSRIRNDFYINCISINF